MRLKEIGLKNFRNLIQVNFSRSRFEHNQRANAQGKTNLLEAVYFLATTTSQWQRIQFDQSPGFMLFSSGLLPKRES